MESKIPKFGTAYRTFTEGGNMTKTLEIWLRTAGPGDGWILPPFMAIRAPKLLVKNGSPTCECGRPPEATRPPGVTVVAES